MKTSTQFQEAMRVLLCMDFNTYMKIFNWHGEDYAKEKYNKMVKNPASYICSLDLDNITKLFNHLQNRVDTTPNSIKIIKDL